jgi:hypothetical protein
MFQRNVTSRFQRRVNQAKKKKNAHTHTHSMKQATSRALLISCLAYSSAMKMEGIFFSKTLVDFHQTAWHVPEGTAGHNRHCCENLRSNMFMAHLFQLIQRSPHSPLPTVSDVYMHINLCHFLQFFKPCF